MTRWRGYAGTWARACLRVAADCLIELGRMYVHGFYAIPPDPGTPGIEKTADMRDERAAGDVP